MASYECGTDLSLIEFDSTVLRQLLEEETKLWLQKPCHVSNCGLGEGWSEVNTKDDAIKLLRHGKKLKQIHEFFKTLTPSRCLSRLQGQIEQDFQVIEQMDKNNKNLFRGTQTTKARYKETSKPLNFQEQHVYKSALLAALNPLCTQLDKAVSHNNHSDEDKLQDLSISPTSKECMLYDKDPISPSSIFSIDSENLCELVRRAFGLTQRRHGVYIDEVEKQYVHDPAMVRELYDYLAVLKDGCHPYFRPNAFLKRECYEEWLKTEVNQVEKLIETQEQLVSDHDCIVVQPQATPLNFKDKHVWYKNLLVKLYRLESVNSRLNVVTNEPIPTAPLSAESSRLLNEFGERYRIGELYRRISLLEYLARNFETKQWYCNYVISVIKSITSNLDTKLGEFILEEEVQMFQNAIVVLRNQLEHTLTRINRMFPRNTPEGGLQSVLNLFTLLYDLDKNEILREKRVYFKNGTLHFYLKKCVKEEMFTNYEAQKIKIASQTNMLPFSQNTTPRMINLIILGIIEMVKNYRMYYKNEFKRYFDIVQIAVDVFYNLLMQDVQDLCNSEQHFTDIDYRMIALAYKLTSLDKEYVWEKNLSIDKQTWREPFLKRSLTWIDSLRNNIRSLVLETLQHDNWLGLILDKEHHIELTKSWRRKQTTPKNIDNDDLSSAKDSKISITPSATSAFVQVNNRSSIISPRTITDEGDQSISTGMPNDVISGTDTPQWLPRHLQRTRHTSIPGSSQSVISSVSSHSSSYDDALSTLEQDTDNQYNNEDDDIDDDIGDDIDGDCDEDITHHFQYVPLSSSFVDLLCMINRTVATVTHISHVLCPKATRKIDDSLRLTPDGEWEVEEILENGRSRLLNELVIIVDFAVSFYGYYVMLTESYGIHEDTISSIIGQKCHEKFCDVSQFLNDNNVIESDRQNANINLLTSLKACIERTALSVDSVTSQMCIRLNNIRTLKRILSVLIETCVATLVDSTSDDDVRDQTGSCSSSQDATRLSSWSTVAASSPQLEIQEALRNESNILTMRDLEELEEGLAKIIAYKANIKIYKLLQLVSSLNLRGFSNRKILYPVLKATRRNIKLFSKYLYQDCFALVIRYFWLTIVKNLETEKDNLIFLTDNLKERVHLLLDSLSFFIEIFQDQNVSLVFIINSVESLVQSLNVYLLTTTDLIGVFGGLQTRTSSVLEGRINRRHCYQQPPSNRVITRLRIELHSEHAYFTGARFVQCVTDKIRSYGDTSLGICAMTHSSDEQSAINLGQYLLEKDVIVCIGETTLKQGLEKSYESEEDLLNNRTGNYLITPNMKQYEVLNNVRRSVPQSSLDTESNYDQEVIDIDDIVQCHDQPSDFINGKNVYYKFKMMDMESCESSSNMYHEDNQGKEHKKKDDILHVLFTRRFHDKEAMEFLFHTHDELLGKLHMKTASKKSQLTKCCAMFFSRDTPAFFS